MSSSPGYEKEKERDEGRKERDREDEARGNNESEVCNKERRKEGKEGGSCWRGG